jgi:anti-anti-sigma factor
MLLDLTGVPFFSSAGVAVLATFADECALEAVGLRVVPTGNIERGLSIVGLDQVVGVGEDRGRGGGGR